MRRSRNSRAIFSLAVFAALGGCKISTSFDFHGCLEDCVPSQGSPFDASPTFSLVPTPVAGGLRFKAVSLGWRNACAVTTSGDAYCWGQIAGANSHIAKAPERVPGGFSFDTISAGDGLACGITTDKRTMCWGLNDAGQAGNGASGLPISVPTPVAAPVAFKSIAVGGWQVGGAKAYRSTFACGLAITGVIYCWGTDDLGQLGSGGGTKTLHASPELIAGDHRFSALAGNGFATPCALERNGAAICWGRNDYSELGTAKPDTEVHAPTSVASDLKFVALSTWYATCGITTTGDTYCWGSSGISAVGSSSVIPRLVTSIPFVSIAAGAQHACGLTAGGAVYCWGSNTYGALGDGTKQPSRIPVLVATDLRFTSIVAGSDETCGLTVTGEAYCWGSDDYSSMLGRGT